MVLATRPNIDAAPRSAARSAAVTLAAVGSWAERELADIHADVAFLGTNGLSVERGLTTPDLAEAAVKRALVANAPAHRRAHGPLASSAAPSSRTSCRCPQVDTIITDSGAGRRSSSTSSRPPARGW